MLEALSSARGPQILSACGRCNVAGRRRSGDGLGAKRAGALGDQARSRVQRGADSRSSAPHFRRPRTAITTLHSSARFLEEVTALGRVFRSRLPGQRRSRLEAPALPCRRLWHEVYSTRKNRCQTRLRGPEYLIPFCISMYSRCPPRFAWLAAASACGRPRTELECDSSTTAIDAASRRFSRDEPYAVGRAWCCGSSRRRALDAAYGWTPSPMDALTPQGRQLDQPLARSWRRGRLTILRPVRVTTNASSNTSRPTLSRSPVRSSRLASCPAGQRDAIARRLPVRSSKSRLSMRRSRRLKAC